MVPGHCSLETRPLITGNGVVPTGTGKPGSVPWPPDRVCHSSNDSCTQFGTGRLDLTVRRAGWECVVFDSLDRREMARSASDFDPGASSQGLPPVGLLPFRTTWSYVLTFSCHFIIHLHCRYPDAIPTNHPIHCPVRFFLTSLAPWKPTW